MPNQTEICNLALIDMGEPQINSIEDQGKAPETLNAVWSHCLNDVMSEHDWHFAREWASLAVDSTFDSPDDDFEYAYQLPADFLRMAESVKLTKESYSVCGTHLLSNTEDLKIRYIKLVEDPTKYPPNFVNALVARLIVASFTNIANRASKSMDWVARYEQLVLPKAIFQDTINESGRNMINSDSWLDARDC